MDIIKTSKVILDGWNRRIQEEDLKAPTTPQEALFLYRRAELANILSCVDPEILTEEEIDQSRGRLRLLFVDLEHCGKHQEPYLEKLRQLDPHKRDTIIPTG